MPPAKSIRRLIDDLNAEQRQAVTTTAGPVLVLAGAGTGKTRVITVRVAHLLAKGVAPENVMAVTFTNKAAAEMRERVAAMVGAEAAKALTISTFHSFCARTLREHAVKLGLSARFAICDASDQLASVRSALRELRVSEGTTHPGYLQSQISLFKNKLISSERCLDDAVDDNAELCARVYEKYEEILRRQRHLDFDDLLIYTVRLLKQHPAVARSYQERYQFVMVDEFQDTNEPQYEIVHGIAGAHRNLCVVGDDDQSIYSWRGADIRKILGFERDFPGATVVRLETNYRSTAEILAAANLVIGNNPSRHEKRLRSALGSGAEPVISRVKDEEAEAEEIVNAIVRLVDSREARLSDFAILFRTQTQPRPFERELRSRSLPYVLIGGMSFFDRKEVRDVLAYLKLMANPHDEVSFLRILNCPPRGIGKTTIDRALEFATEQGIPVTEAFPRAAEIGNLPPVAVAAAAELAATLAALGRRAPQVGLVATIEAMLDRVGYQAEVARVYPDPETRTARWASVMDILNFADTYSRRASRPSLQGFLEELTLSAADDRKADDDGKREAVTLMTLHAAKGLEFPRVFLVGLEEGILPHLRSVEENTLEEERRLMYVGITRAQRFLTISYTGERSRYGRRVPSMPSRFLYEMKGKSPPEGWRAAGTEDPTARQGARAKGKGSGKKRKSTKQAASGKKPKRARSATGEHR